MLQRDQRIVKNSYSFTLKTAGCVTATTYTYRIQYDDNKRNMVIEAILPILT